MTPIRITAYSENARQIAEIGVREWFALLAKTATVHDLQGDKDCVKLTLYARGEDN